MAGHRLRRQQLKGEWVQAGDCCTSLKFGDCLLRIVLTIEQVEIPAVTSVRESNDQSHAAFQYPLRDVVVEHPGEKTLQEKFPIQFSVEPSGQSGLGMERLGERLTEGGGTRVPPCR